MTGAARIMHGFCSEVPRWRTGRPVGADTVCPYGTGIVSRIEKGTVYFFRKVKK